MASTRALEKFNRELEVLRPPAIGYYVADLTVAQGLWMYRMLYSPHPFLEKLTLFWHNHFATSGAKVRNGGLMERQIDFLRSHALAKFGETLDGITFDPAMLVWLDAASNRRGRPNENYARELMELFSLGVGNYTERDIQEAARALTGWSANGNTAQFLEREFDPGQKTIFGKTGPFGAKDAVRLCLGASGLCAVSRRQVVPRILRRRRAVRRAFSDPACRRVSPTRPGCRLAGADDVVEPVVFRSVTSLAQGQKPVRLFGGHGPYAGRTRRPRNGGQRGGTIGGRVCSSRRASRAGKGDPSGSTRTLCCAATTWRSTPPAARKPRRDSIPPDWCRQIRSRRRRRSWGGS